MKEKGETRTNSRAGRRLHIAKELGILRFASGQSLLEVALLLPILLAVLLGGIELGRYAYISILVGNAARAGAAYGAQNLALSIDTLGIQAAAESDFRNQFNGQNAGTLSVASNTSCGCDNAGTITAATNCTTTLYPTAGTCAAGHWVVMVSVTASGTFNSLFNYPGIPNSLAVSNTATLRVPQI